MKILIVEDERGLSMALQHILTDAGYQTAAVYTGDDGLHYAGSGAFDLILLDVMLPEMDGFAVVKALRRQQNRVPVLMLTAKSALSDRVNGLDAGADDYLTKPFEPEELLARIRALLRRGDQAVADEITAFDLKLMVDSHDLRCGERSIRLSSREYQIMRLLMNGNERYFSKEELLMRAWDMDTEAGDNCEEAYISFLRKKLAYLKSTAMIATLRKVGYRLEEQA
ncbi:MAG: response regulator transcription factor [Aristaeellaceae bacterium]